MRIFATAWYWRLAIVRCVIYGCIIGWGVFKAGTEGFERWSDMTNMQHIKLLGDMGMGFGGVLLAFLDQSIQKLSDGSPDNKSTIP